MVTCPSLPDSVGGQKLLFHLIVPNSQCGYYTALSNCRAEGACGPHQQWCQMMRTDQRCSPCPYTWMLAAVGCTLPVVVGARGGDRRSCAAGGRAGTGADKF